MQATDLIFLKHVPLPDEGQPRAERNDTRYVIDRRLEFEHDGSTTGAHWRISEADSSGGQTFQLLSVRRMGSQYELLSAEPLVLKGLPGTGRHFLDEQVDLYAYSVHSRLIEFKQQSTVAASLIEWDRVDEHLRSGPYG